MKERPSMRIVIADDSEDYLMALFEAISKFPEYSVVGSARNGEELLQVCASTSPDVAMTDIQMPKMDGLAALRELSNQFPKTLLVAFSVWNSPPVETDAISAGAHVFFAKDQALEVLSTLFEHYSRVFLHGFNAGQESDTTTT